MSNLFKSKFVLGLMLVAAVMFSGTAEAAITKNLKQGMKDAQVLELQQGLNAKGFTVSTTGAGSAGYETTTFGSKTTAAVKAWQAANGVPATGFFGPLSRAAWTGSTTTGGNTTLPAGCTTTSGFSPLTGQACNGTTTNTQTGPVTATLASTNPASSTLVAGQATANLAQFTFNGSGTVTTVTLQRIGVSADATPSKVYLFDGAVRLTDAASVSNNGIVTFNVPAGIFTVNGTKTISVKADIASTVNSTSTSGQTVGMMLATFTTSSGTTTANLSGNIHSIASATLAAVTLSGTITPSGATLNPGPNVTVWQGTLNISQRDVWMKRLALRNVGSAPANAFANFKLFVNGVQVGSATGLDANGYVTFDMNSTPVNLVSGSRVVRVDADIVSGASRTVQFSLRQAADADFVDSSFGVNVTPALTGAALPWEGSVSYIGGNTGGSLTVERDVTSPSTTATLSGSDVNLGIFKLTAYGESIKVETLTAGGTFDGTQGSTSDAAVTLRNGRILVSTDGTNWTQYGSTATIVPAGTAYTLNYTVVPGTPVWVKVNADVYDNDGTGQLDAGDKLTVSLIAGSSNAQKVDSLGSIAVPASTVSANELTVASASVSLTKNSTYANQTVALPSTNAKIGSWNLVGSSTEDVLLTTLSFDVDEVTVSADDFNESDFTNMYVVVKNGSTIVAQPAPLGTVSAADNNYSINYTLAKNATVSVELFANLGSTVTTSEKVKTDLSVTGTAMVSGISVSASNVDGQTLTAGTASITATTDASTPVASIVYDNQTVTAAAFKFAAVTAAYDITDLTFTLADATVASSVELYDGGTLVASKPGAATVTFNGLNWNVPVNTNKVLTVKLVLGNIGIGAGTTGAAQTVTLTAFTAVNKSTGVSALGTESNPAGNAMYAYAAIPTITNVALPTTVLANGTATLAKFTISSNGGTIGWKKLVLTETESTSVDVASPTLWDADTNTQVSTSTNSIGSGLITFVTTNEEQVSGTKTYYVKGTVTLTSPAAGDSVTVNIAQPLTAYDAPDAYADVLTDDSTASFVWTDQSASGHGTSTDDWNHGYLVKNLPTDTQVLSY